MDTEAHGYLEGGKAVWAVRRILGTPGRAAIDFETYPTDPKWHRQQAAASAPRGRKAEAGDRAEREARLAGRAHRRKACVLAIAHSDGSTAVVRLTDPDRELPSMFGGYVAKLVAHHSQFDTEVLLRHGVEAVVDCTLIAAKCLYLVAVPDDRPQPVSFGLADLVEREFGRKRDKTLRDRDWRDAAALDPEAVDYCRQDAVDCLELWQLYERRLTAGLDQAQDVRKAAAMVRSRPL